MDQRTVDIVVQQVLAALRQGAPPAEARADAKTSLSGARAVAEGAAPAAKSFLTAAGVRQRLADSGDGHLELAANEFLTPAAQDVVQQMQVAVARKTTQANAVVHPAANSAERQAPTASCPHPVPARGPADPLSKQRGEAPFSALFAGGAFAIMVDRENEKTAAVLTAVGREGVRLLDWRRADCPLANFEAMCESIAAGEIAGGIAILKYAADAIILGNKFRGVRAVQGARPASVAAAVRHVGANLLVLEHEFSTFFELRAMIRTFVADRQLVGISADLLAAIARAEGI